MSKHKFDKDKEYGNFVAIVLVGVKPVFQGFATLLNVPWDETSVGFARILCMRDSCKWIPEEYQRYIKIIECKPGDSADLYMKIGTVGWKYAPEVKS